MGEVPAEYTLSEKLADKLEENNGSSRRALDDLGHEVIISARSMLKANSQSRTFIQFNGILTERGTQADSKFCQQKIDSNLLNISAVRLDNEVVVVVVVVMLSSPSSVSSSAIALLAIFNNAPSRSTHNLAHVTAISILSVAFSAIAQVT